MLNDSYNLILQPRHGQNGIGNLEHDHIITYLNHNKRLNCGAVSEKEKAVKDKRLKKRNAKNRLKYQMTANTSGTRFDIVKTVLESFGFTLNDEEVFSDSYLIWSDGFISQERLSELKSYQHINHFMGMVEICRKDYLAKNFSKMCKLRPDDYNYFPRAWLIPQEKNVFQKFVQENKNPKCKKYFILKPSNGAMGNGIRLLSEDDTIKTTESCILQEYIERPFLLDGFKNDLRIYVLVTCCDPLRAFVYREGLVRLSTEKYVMPSNPKSESPFMHLTNYSVNKKNSKYSKGTDEASGSKRSLTSVFNLFKTKFKIDTDKLWKSIIDIIVKTLLLAQPSLFHNYKMCRPGEYPTANSICFEILGFDIMLDQALCPWLLEVNRSPSFGIDEKLDRKIKGGLLNDSLRLLNIRSSDKRKCVTLQKQRVFRRLTLAAVKSKVDFLLNGDALRKKKEIEKRKQELIDLYIRVKSSSSREYFENQNMGNFTRIFPPEEKYNFDNYSKILIDSFTLFNQMHSPNTPSDVNQATNQMTQSFIQNQFREEDLLEQIKDCEKEENSILEKFNLQRNAENTTIIPKNEFFYDSSDGDCSLTTDADDCDSTESDDDVTSEGRVNDKSGRISSLNTNINHTTVRKGQVHLPETQKHSRRPTSVISKCSSSRSIESTGIMKSKMVGKDQKRIPSLKNSAHNKHSKRYPSHLKLQINGALKHIDDDKTSIDSCFLEDLNNTAFKSTVFEVQIYEEVLKIILTALNNLSIRYPGQSDAETKAMLLKINTGWETNRRCFSTYWLITLNSNKREKILQIVKNNVNTIVKENFKYSIEIRNNPINRLLTKVYNRLLWNRGQGLIQCFTNPKSWKLIFSQSSDQIKPCEMQICSRVVQLCLDCVLIVFQFSNHLYDLDKEDEPKHGNAGSTLNHSLNSLEAVAIAPSS